MNVDPVRFTMQIEIIGYNQVARKCAKKAGNKNPRDDCRSRWI